MVKYWIRFNVVLVCLVEFRFVRGTRIIYGEGIVFFLDIGFEFVFDLRGYLLVFI